MGGIRPARHFWGLFEKPQVPPVPHDDIVKGTRRGGGPAHDFWFFQNPRRGGGGLNPRAKTPATEVLYVSEPSLVLVLFRGTGLVN